MAAAEILHFDLGIMVIVGTILGLVSALIAMKILFTLFDKGFWKAQKDETGVEVYEERKSAETTGELSFFLALLPVILPVILILIGTVMGALGEVPSIITFLSNKNMALLLGALSAYLVAAKP